MHWTFRRALFLSRVGDPCLMVIQLSVSSVCCPEVDVETYHRALVSVDHAQGLPVGLQVMCWRLQEEKVLALVEAIGQCMDQTYNPGGTHTGEWFNHSQ